MHLNSSGATMEDAAWKMVMAILQASSRVSEYGRAVRRAWLQGVPDTDGRRARRAARDTGMTFTVDRSQRPTRYRFR